jgi:hypothetical protein
MAFQGGALSTLGITPSFITGLATQTASTGVPQALGQIWQGSGQSFAGSAGQALVGGLSASAINIALNSDLVTNVVGPQGFPLSSGENLLASTITPYVTGAVAAGINQNIQQSLQGAGAFGPILSNFGTGLINQASQGITNGIFSATGTATNFKMFPGGGDEPPADYGGSSYTLTDVVFSLQPANQGPQAFGLQQGITFPESITTLPFNQLASMPPLAPNATANSIKSASMSNQVGKKAFSSNLSRNFNTSVSLR